MYVLYTDMVTLRPTSRILFSISHVAKQIEHHLQAFWWSPSKNTEKTQTTTRICTTALKTFTSQRYNTCTDPRFSKSPCLCGNYEASPDSWILGPCRFCVLYPTGFLEILGLRMNPTLAFKRLTKPALHTPKIPKQKGYRTCRGPRFPRKKCNFVRSLPDSSEKSWDFWESGASAGFSRDVHQDSCACAWSVPIVLFKPLEIFLLFRFFSIQAILKAGTGIANSLRTKALTSLKCSLDCSGLEWSEL